MNEDYTKTFGPVVSQVIARGPNSTVNLLSVSHKLIKQTEQLNQTIKRDLNALDSKSIVHTLGIIEAQLERIRQFTNIERHETLSAFIDRLAISTLDPQYTPESTRVDDQL